IVEASDNALSGIELYKKRAFDVVLSDVKLQGMDGITLLSELKKYDPEATIIMITGYGSVEGAVEATRLGAFDYIRKPFRLEDVSFTIKKAIRFRQLEKENYELKQQLRDRYNFHHIIGISTAMQRLYDQIIKVANSDSTVLIYGESGTGKELVAKTIHYQSARSSKPLIPVNCGAIPEELLESELFGHERGAFTGAINMRIGRFELADGGTLFLDEVGELSRHLQVKLLRVLQEREFERVGGTKTIKVDVRIIAATNRLLEEEVKKGKFREDLFYRLNVIPLYVPPLRERKDDIELLSYYFLKKFCKKNQRPMMRIHPEVLEYLKNYPWPGNVRELENLMERLTVLKDEAEKTITLQDLPTRFTTKHYAVDLTFTEDGIDLNRAVQEFEKRLIQQALEASNGVKSKAASLLKINRTTLVEKIKRLNAVK
ncbi:MAG: sigma-54-dependent Fis family transcriptional regulator, partial [Nitrospirae bacterium]